MNLTERTELAERVNRILAGESAETVVFALVGVVSSTVIQISPSKKVALTGADAFSNRVRDVVDLNYDRLRPVVLGTQNEGGHA